LHQGSIQVHSVEGAGSAFQLWFSPSDTYYELHWLPG
jgi:two-component system nitrogen regulation sensor histidine kinase NtrY